MISSIFHFAPRPIRLHVFGRSMIRWFHFIFIFASHSSFIMRWNYGMASGGHSKMQINFILQRFWFCRWRCVCLFFFRSKSIECRITRISANQISSDLFNSFQMFFSSLFFFASFNWIVCVGQMLVCLRCCCVARVGGMVYQQALFSHCCYAKANGADNNSNTMNRVKRDCHVCSHV